MNSLGRSHILSDNLGDSGGTTRVAPDVMNVERRHGSGFYSKRDLVMTRGQGVMLWDQSGRAFIDCTSGHGVANIGHCHPRVAAAIAEQATRLITCPEIFYNDRRAALLEQLSRRLPGDLNRLFLCNSGTEAVEAALKIARLTTGRDEIVAMMRGFHGRTMGSLSATWEPRYREPFEPLIPGVRHIPFGNPDAAAEAVSTQTAAVIVEVVQGEGGVRTASSEWFQYLRRRCDEVGALLIVDEVQTGFGRTGRWFACEHHDLVPDLLCLGKAIAGGFPMGAVAMSDRVPSLPAGSHGSTFGGNPLACAAAIETLDVYEAEGLIERASVLGNQFLTQLHGLTSPLIREVRGVGLMAGLELKIRVTPVLRKLMERGVLALPAGASVLRLLPPLVIHSSELDRVVESIAGALDDCSAERGH